jgi:hypothetical protein
MYDDESARGSEVLYFGNRLANLRGAGPRPL